MFTALLLADMVQRREVALDEPVASLLPAGTRIPEKGKPITLLDLATYTSGLPRMPGNWAPGDSKNPFADYTAAMMKAFLASYDLKYEPGTHYEYANLGLPSMKARSVQAHDANLSRCRTGISRTAAPAPAPRARPPTTSAPSSKPRWASASLR